MRNSVVVDTSIAVKWALKEEDSNIALALVTEWTDLGMEVIAPPLLAYEATNALYRNMRKGDIAFSDAERGLNEVILKLVAIEPELDFDIHTRAIELAHQFGLSATYDSHYLALAEREGCELWTADTRLWNSLKGKLSWVRWMGDYLASGNRKEAL